ncbi:efflux RND transporter periplasmic adaptor subunit [Dyadobacter frigoris]|uniref:Efflux RND transporter periplasmic adaptor subunit n=1 Tax=Dyadobacter frigoris TaxID=2576211 RepID=A0A4U6CTX8_9BACT|nr:efflux RND transporter periplasmic adaptor subunit [Dyadobacter frigoris]TKT88150.1 efflux RND transporter periplasmic adaptor subunit [Dyadobacter frigoris]GLU53766.1 MexH family multidrug efflux RND transporter periplasmic adaptor subunit [Dyadobacter frigoris]
MKRLLIFVAVIAVLGLTAAKLLTNKENTEAKIYQPDPNLKVGVRTAVAELRNMSQENKFLGSFSPNRKIEIRPQAGGEIVKLPIEEGQHISAGQLLAKLDDDQLRFQVEALQVTLEGHQNDLRRFEVLVKGDAVPAVNIERTKLSIRSTQAQIKQLNKQIANTTILAPFSGIVTSKMVEKGSVVAIGTAMAEITDIASLKLVVNVPEKAINQFRMGQTISVQTEVYPDSKFQGKVTMISAEGDEAHNYPVEITVPNTANNPLKAGMYGSIANLNEIKGQSLAVPRQAIMGSAKEPQLYVVENGKAVLKSVSIGLSTNEFYEITKGLKAGDQVVTSGQINLQNGTLISAQ